MRKFRLIWFKTVPLSVLFQNGPFVGTDMWTVERIRRTHSAYFICLYPNIRKKDGNVAACDAGLAV